MILNRDCFFYKKSDFINRQSELSPDSIVYIADTHQIYTHGAFFECALTTAKVKELIESYGYLTPADLPELTGGAAPLEGTYIDGVTVDGHNITIHRGNFSEINVGSASKLENSRDIILSGDISGQVSFDGTKDVTIETTVHNSETADRLTNPRTISLIGQSSGSAYFDGSRDISIETTTNQLNSINANNQSLNDLVTLNGYLGNLFYGAGGNTSLNKPENVDSFGLFTFKSASGNYSTQILGSPLDRIYVRSGADSSLGNWNTLAYLTDNVASATKLQNTRTFTISDGQHTGSSSNFNGTSNVTLDLPDIINADIVGNLTGDITGNVTGDLYGNADTATKLETGRNINGTLFDGTKNIITNQWGTARNIGIVNSDGSGTPIPVSVNGGSNVNLKLPTNIKANITGNLNGNASTASKLQTPVDINLLGDATGSVSFDGSKDVTINVDVNTASKLENAFTLTLGGDTTGSVSIDGSKNVTLSVTVKDNSHNHTVSNITDLNSTWDKYLTGGGLYERNLVMNGTTYPVFTDVSGASTVTWYAPTTAGTSGYILQSTGGIPKWISISTLGSLLDGRYVNVSGDTMTGGLTLPGNQTFAFNSQGLMFSDNTGRIGTNNKGELGIYAKTDIYLRPDSSTDSSATGLYISSDVITYNNYPLLHSNNYTNYVYSKSQSDARYVKNGEGVDTAYIRYAGINGAQYNFLSNVDNPYPFMIYAPTNAGTSAYILQSTGNIPQWISRSALQHQLFSAGGGCDAIPANADLNNYRTPGNYYCSINTTVETIANTPSNYAFNLTVLDAAGVIQIYREYGYSSSAREFTRRYYNGTWTSWVQTPRLTDIYTPTELDDRYVKKTGDTMTGMLSISRSTGEMMRLNTTYSEAYHSVYIDGAYKGAIGYNSDYGTILYNRAAAKYVGLRDDGTFRDNSGNLFWHSGNDGSGSELDADLLDGTHKSGLLTSVTSTSAANLSVTVGGTTKSVADLYATYLDGKTLAETRRGMSFLTSQFSTAGWYRVFTSLSTNADYCSEVIMHIGRNYYSPQNENYTFSICVGYNGDISITQLSGVMGGHLITKIRVVWDNSQVFHIDIYSDESGYNNTYGVTGQGYGTFYAFTPNATIPSGYTSYEFTTVDGCKSDRGFTGTLSGNASSATKLQTARTITLTGDVSGSVSFDGSKNVSIATTVANNSHTHTISNISDLHANWDDLLKATPSAYVTRWPAISEVTGKQNLVIKLNGGTTEGTNQFTFNGVTSKSVNITPGTIGAPTTSGTGATGTWAIDISGNAAGLVNSDPDSFVNRLVYHIEVGGEVGSTEGGGVWGVPSDSQDAQYGQGQYIRMGWPSGTYYTDIYTGPNNAGTARGLQWRQVVANYVINATHREGWRLLLDTLNYSATLDSRYLLKSTYTASDVLAKLKTVDGSGSGLDADLLDGTHKADLFTALSSTSSTNLSVTIGGTTKTIADLYANYADTAGSVNWINVTNKPDFSEYATVSWVTNNFDSVSISRDQTSGVRIAVINVSGTSYSLYAPTAGEVSLTWDSISGKPSCYTPCDHGHHFDDITFNNTGTNRQYLAGDGRFYTISYNEISGTPGQYSLPILSNSILGGAKVNLKHNTSCTFESSHTSTSSSVTVNSRTTVSGRYYAVEADSNGYLFVNVPWEAGESGGGITSINDAAGSSSATGYLITDASGSTVYRRALKSSDITDALGYTPSDTDTKNTAGATNDSTNKLYLVGARSQDTSPQTYTESGCYISGGQLYSDGKLVATQSWVESNISIDFSMSSTNATNLSLTINGTTKNITNLYADSVDGYDISVVSTTPSTMLTSTIYFVY